MLCAHCRQISDALILFEGGHVCPTCLVELTNDDDSPIADSLRFQASRLSVCSELERFFVLDILQAIAEHLNG